MSYLGNDVRRWMWERRLARWWCAFNCWEWPKTFIARQPDWWGVSVNYDRTYEYCRRAISAIQQVVSNEVLSEVSKDWHQERRRRRGDRW